MFFAENLVNTVIFDDSEAGGTLEPVAGGTRPGGTPYQPFKKLPSKNPLKILKGSIVREYACLSS